MTLTCSIIIGTWVFLFSSLARITLVSGTTAETVTKCEGDNLMLKEPTTEVTAQDFYVFHNGDLVANTSGQGTGNLQNRLVVHSDGSMELTNLTSNDFGEYRVQMKLSNGATKQLVVRLLVREPPETTDGRLSVMSDDSHNTFIRLACGSFTSLGYPSVSVIWRDPVNQLLASTGFSNQFFTLDIPVNMARSGSYCCQIDCKQPSHCCLSEKSPLRQCAMVEVKTGEKDSEEVGRCKDGVALVNIAGLLQRVSEIYNIAKHLERSSADLTCSERSSGLILTGCPVEKRYLLYYKHCLKLYTLQRSYTEAKRRCEDDGTHLFYFKSRDMDSPTLELLMYANGRNLTGVHEEGVWVGADDLVTEGRFLWNDGTTLADPGLWDSGEPNDKDRNEDCVQVLKRKDVVLNDLPCEQKLAFVCQGDVIL